MKKTSKLSKETKKMDLPDIVEGFNEENFTKENASKIVD
jgi:hypothetical protein